MISKHNITIAQIKEEIEKLKGKRINMSVNQGRKRYANFEGIIQDTYNSIFIVRLTNNNDSTIKKLDALKGETSFSESKESLDNTKNANLNTNSTLCNSNSETPQFKKSEQNIFNNSNNSDKEYKQNANTLKNSEHTIQNAKNETKSIQKLKERNDISIKNKQTINCKTTNSSVVDLRTYSYIDILCGNVDIDGFMQKIK